MYEYTPPPISVLEPALKLPSMLLNCKSCFFNKGASCRTRVSKYLQYATLEEAEEKLGIDCP